MKDNLDWVHHDSKTFDDERFMEEVMGRYVEKNATHVKGYTKEFVDKLIEEKDKEINRLNNLIDKTTNYYLKTLAKNGSMPDEAVEMFNLLEGNIK